MHAHVSILKSEYAFKRINKNENDLIDFIFSFS